MLKSATIKKCLGMINTKYWSMVILVWEGDVLGKDLKDIGHVLFIKLAFWHRWSSKNYSLKHTYA